MPDQRSDSGSIDDLADLLPEPGVSPKSGIPIEKTRALRQFQRRYTTGKSIQRETNSCVACKHEQIPQIDEFYLHGVDAKTLSLQYGIEHKDFANHVWRHRLSERRFRHPADLYKSFIDQVDFGAASPDMKLMAALKAIDRLSGQGNKPGGQRGGKQVNFYGVDPAELARLLSKPVPKEPEWDGETGVRAPHPDDPVEVAAHEEGDTPRPQTESEAVGGFDELPPDESDTAEEE